MPTYIQHPIEDAEYTTGYTQDEADREQEEKYEELRTGAEQADKAWKLSLWRQPVNEKGRPVKSTLTFLSEHDMDEFEGWNQILMFLQSEFGAGKYRAQVRDDKGRLQMNKLAVVEEPRSSKDDPGKMAGGSTTEILRTMNESMERQSQFMASLFQRYSGGANPNQTDPMQNTVQMMAVMVSMMEVLKPKEQRNEDILSQIMKIKEVAGVMGMGPSSEVGELGPWNAITETVRQFGPMFQQAMDKDQRQLPAPRPEAPRQEIPMSDQRYVRRDTAQTPHSPNEDEPEAAEFRKMLLAVLSFKRTGIPAEVAADQILDQMDEGSEQEQNLVAFLDTPNALDVMVSVAPEIEAEGARDWFAALRQAILDVFAPAGEGDGEIEPVNTNTLSEKTDTVDGGPLTPDPSPDASDAPAPDEAETNSAGGRRDEGDAQ